MHLDLDFHRTETKACLKNNSLITDFVLPINRNGSETKYSLAFHLYIYTPIIIKIFLNTNLADVWN